MPQPMNGSDYVWSWENKDYFQGDRLVCAPNGNGSSQYETLCTYARFGLGPWYLVLGLVTAVISRRTRRLRTQLTAVTIKQSTQKKHTLANARRKMEISNKLEEATVLMQLFGGALMMQSALGTMYPSSEQAGVLCDALFAITYIFTGQSSFWARQASLHTRYLLTREGADGGHRQTTWSLRNIVDFLEEKVTPLAYGITVVLVANGVCGRYQLITVIFASTLIWGFALMHELLFTRLATIANVIRIHNHAGGDHAVVERRQSVVMRMVLNLVLELVVTFFTSVTFPLAILLFDAHASSVRLLRAATIGLSINCAALTWVSIARLHGQKRLEVRLQHATSKATVDNTGSICTSSVLQIRSSVPVQNPT
jgi:hypothetical protein